MAKRKGRWLSSFAGSVVAFVLFALLILSTILVSVKISFLNGDHIVRAMRETGYYDCALEALKEKITEKTVESGLPQQLSEKMLDCKIFANDVEEYVRATVAGKIYESRAERNKEDVTELVYRYFRDEGMSVTEQQIEEMGRYSDQVSALYEEAVHVPYMDLIGMVNKEAGPWVVKGLAAVLVVICLLLLILWAICEFQIRALRYVIYSSTATVAASCLLVAGAKKVEQVLHPSIEPAYLSEMLGHYWLNGVKCLGMLALLWAVVTVVLFTLKAMADNFK